MRKNTTAYQPHPLVQYPVHTHHGCHWDAIGEQRSGLLHNPLQTACASAQFTGWLGEESTNIVILCWDLMLDLMGNFPSANMAGRWELPDRKVFSGKIIVIQWIFQQARFDDQRVRGILWAYGVVHLSLGCFAWICRVTMFINQQILLSETKSGNHMPQKQHLIGMEFKD